MKPDNTPFLSLIAEGVIETQKEYCWLLGVSIRDSADEPPDRTTAKIRRTKSHER